MTVPSQNMIQLVSMFASVASSRMPMTGGSTPKAAQISTRENVLERT